MEEISKGIAILISLSFVLAIMVSLLYLLLMQINEFSHEWSHSEKTSGLNEISIYISQHFEISTEQQLIFFKNSINNSASQALSFLRNAAYLFSKHFFIF
jgi:predicted PurR-regulated permease PerM